MPTEPIEVGVIIGSDSDLPIAEQTRKILEQFGVGYAATIRSAHRTPHDILQIVAEWEERGCKTFIAIAGAAAHLAGVIASYTVRPVIAVPLAGSTQTAVNGLDALLSCAQMPAGIPVATVAINGAANAAYLAIAMLAMSDIKMQEKLREHRANLVDKTRERAAKLKQDGWPD